MEAKAIAKGLRISPYRARLIATLIRGKQADEAIAILNNIQANTSDTTYAEDAILAKGKSRMAQGYISSYSDAIDLFKSIPGWKDADEQIIVCNNKIKELLLL